MSTSTTIGEGSLSVAQPDGDVLEKSVITTPVMQLPGRKLLVITTTHTTSIVDDLSLSTGLPSTLKIPSLPADCSAKESLENREGPKELATFELAPRLGMERQNTASRKGVRNACVSCFEKHKTCDVIRPCTRCLKDGIECKARVRKSSSPAKRRSARSGGAESRLRQPTMEDPEPIASSSAVTLDITEPNVNTVSAGNHGTYYPAHGYMDSYLPVENMALLQANSAVPDFFQYPSN